ncbi:MAG: hypothetical protein M5R36_23875 [Deltaproteobacteria bacterium]|nr:hypothetical protein [Deltaproteobacteria bacterium]
MKKIRKEILHRNETNDQALRSFQMMDKAGLRYDIDHIFGIPGEEEQDFFEAARMYAGLKKLNRIKCHLLSYFPGTPIVEQAHREGLIDDDRMDQINRGEIGDYFHSPTVNDKKALARINDFHRLYKAITVIPRPMVEIILRTRLNRYFGKLPTPVVIGFQILGAFKGRDYRFWLYAKYYFHRLTRHFLLRRLFREPEPAPATIPAR